MVAAIQEDVLRSGELQGKENKGHLHGRGTPIYIISVDNNIVGLTRRPGSIQDIEQIVQLAVQVAHNLFSLRLGDSLVCVSEASPDDYLLAGYTH